MRDAHRGLEKGSPLKLHHRRNPMNTGSSAISRARVHLFNNSMGRLTASTRAPMGTLEDRLAYLTAADKSARETREIWTGVSVAAATRFSSEALDRALRSSR